MRTDHLSTPPQPVVDQRTQPTLGRLAGPLAALALAALMTTVSVAAITATDPAWHGTTPENISNSSYDMARQPDIAVGPTGQMLVVWGDGPSKDELDIYVTDNAGGTWATPQLISETTPSSRYPDLLVAGADVFVAWADTSVIHEAKRTGGTWEVRQVLSPVPLIAAGTQARLAASTDRLHVVFNARETGVSDIYHASRLAGTTWPMATCIYTSTEMGAWSPAMIAGPDETLHIVWKEELFSQRAIMYISGTVAGANVNWVPAITLSTGIAQSQLPDIAVDPGGNVHVVWGEKVTDGDDDLYYVRYTRYDESAGSWSAPVRIDPLPVQVNTDLPTHIAPRLAWWEEDSQVTVCVAWYGFRGDDTDSEAEDILLRCSQDGGNDWTGTTRNVSRSRDVPETGWGISFLPSATFDQNGWLHLVWQERAGSAIVSDYEIYHSHAQHLVYLPLVMRNN